MRLWCHLLVSFPLSISEFIISWKTLKNILFWRLSAKKTGKTALRNILSFAFSWFTAVTGEMKPGVKKKKSNNPQNSQAAKVLLNVNFCKMVKTKKKSQPWGSIQCNELSLKCGFQKFPSGTNKF